MFHHRFPSQHDSTIRKRSGLGAGCAFCPWPVESGRALDPPKVGASAGSQLLDRAPGFHMVPSCQDVRLERISAGFNHQ